MISSFTQATKALSKYMPSSLESSYNLDRMVDLMGFLGNPQNSYSVIHVAGTSGKTSTSYYLAGLLKASGEKVGLTVSPHLTQINERVQINLVPLPENEFCTELDEFLRLIKKCSVTPTWFELLIALAFWEFARQQVNYAVIEVGLGGLLDGTNVVTNPNKVCVITDIGFDHVSILGNTIDSIATHKAGIIQDGNEVFCYEYGQNPDALKVIKETCALKNAKLHTLGNEQTKEARFLPKFQQRNFELARSVIDFTNDRDNNKPLSETELKTAVGSAIPGRMEIFKNQGKTIILDGAHNYQKLHSFIESLNEMFPDQSKSALLSFVGGSDYRLEDNLKEISGQFVHIIFTSFKSEQELSRSSVDPELLDSMYRALGQKNTKVINDNVEALHELLKMPEQLLIVTGSFYLLAQLRNLIIGS